MIVEHGVEGLTHRLVAEAADVPLAATTYYFSSLEALLIAAMKDAVERDLEALRASFDELPHDGEIADAIAHAILALLANERRNAVVITELYTAALRRDELRQMAIEWEASWTELLAPRIGVRAAQAIGSATGGIVQSALLRRETPSLDEVAAIVRLVLPGNP